MGSRRQKSVGFYSSNPNFLVLIKYHCLLLLLLILLWYLHSVLQKEATMMHFAVGELLFSIGDDPSGIFVVVSGVVKIQYDPLYDRLKRLEDRGIIPVVEMYTATMDDPMIDYVTSGSVLGELGVLSDNDRAASASCETGVVVYHLSKEAILTAIEMFGDPYDSLESRMWRAIGMRIAAVVLPSQPAFQSWTLDKLKTHLEFSAVPVGPQYAEITIPAFITDTILVYGQVVNGDRESEIYTAPVVIPHRVKKIKPIPPVNVIDIITRIPYELTLTN